MMARKHVAWKRNVTSEVKSVYIKEEYNICMPTQYSSILGNYIMSRS